jgi:hypothetical protein
MNAIDQVYMMNFRMYIEPEGSDTDNNWRRNEVWVTNDDYVTIDMPGHKIHALYVTFGSDVRKWYMYQEIHNMDDIMEAFDILKETLETMGKGSCMFGRYAEPFTKIEFVNSDDRDYYEARQLNFKFSEK